ncbi:MAG: fused response regulator/phosphatase, partial [Chloroflexi bacterium]|nr:fused response regulator/phosphatase [Chloroflexota bacterium]
MSIAIVDDDPDLRRLLSFILRKAGYADLHAVGSAVDLFDLLHSEDPEAPSGGIDLVLL